MNKTRRRKQRSRRNKLSRRYVHVDLGCEPDTLVFTLVENGRIVDVQVHSLEIEK